MTRIPFVSLIAAVLLCSAPVRAAEDVLHLVPAEAMGFVVVRHLADTDAKMSTLAKQVKAQADRGPLAELKKLTGVSKGLDEKGDAVLIAMPPKDTDNDEDVPLIELGLVALVPVTDYGQFIEPLHPATPKEKITEVTLMDKTFLAAKRGAYAVLATADQRSALEAVLEAKRGIDGEVADFQPWLSENDVAIVATQRLIKLPLGMALQEVRRSKQMFANMAGRMPGLEPMLRMMDLYDTVLTTIGENVRMAAAGAKVDSQGTLLVGARAQVVAGGKVDKVLAAIKPAPQSPLAGLPAGPLALAAGFPVSTDAMQSLIDLEVDMFSQAGAQMGLTDDQLKEWRRLIKESMGSTRHMAMAIGPSETLFGNCTAVWRVDDTAKYLANYEKMVEGFNKLAKDTQSPLVPSVELKKIEIDGRTVFRSETTLAAAAAAGPQMNPMMLPPVKAMMDVMFGPDGKLVAYMTAVDEHTMVAGYNSKKALRRALEAVKNPQTGLITAPELAKTVALLPTGAQAVVLVSPQGIMVLVGHIAAKLASLGAPMPDFPPFPATPPAGLAVKVVPHQVQATVVVPAEVFIAVDKYQDALHERAKKQEAPEEE
jgi:hypothetical protein